MPRVQLTIRDVLTGVEIMYPPVEDRYGVYDRILRNLHESAERAQNAEYAALLRGVAWWP